MTASELSAWLGRTLIFGGLEQDDLDRLAHIARETSLQQGDILFEQGDDSDGLYLIISGLVRIYLTTDDGREVTISLLEDGEVIGEMALINHKLRSATVVADTPLEVLHFTDETVAALTAKIPHFRDALVGAVEERIARDQDG